MALLLWLYIYSKQAVYKLKYFNKNGNINV